MGVSDTDFALDRAPTRVEALVMLLRTLGVEDDAKASTATHPFTDVPGWADRYIAFAYENGLTRACQIPTSNRRRGFGYVPDLYAPGAWVQRYGR